jgi:peptidoglycan glycosyltransferase
MTRPILRLYVLVLALFALLVLFTSRWTVFEAGALRDNALNHRSLLEELRIRRGLILADDGRTVLARSIPDAGHTFKRVYPTPAIFSHEVGYSNAALGQRVGLERSRNSALTGDTNELGSIFQQLSGKQREGDSVVTTLDPPAQKLALDQLGGRKGSVVAIDPRTGAVRVMASVPGFDPNHLPTGREQAAQGSPLLNRATQAHYPPGSTFKVVTAAAALDSGRFTPASVLDGRSPITISGVPLANDNGEQFGPIDLTKALTFSVNTVWAQVAVRLGRGTLGRYMKRFGFFTTPTLDYPAQQLAVSRVFSSRGRPLGPGSGQLDVGRVGIGQGGLSVTPLQMAMVASAVANRGKLMRPHLTDRIVDRDGRTVRRINPHVQATVMSARSAAALTAMMAQVVKEGTGTQAALSGIDVAGKTGTAQVGTQGSNLTQPWFIAFAPARDPRVAIAVTVERDNGGFGGTVAAPIAKRVMEELLRHG